MHITCQESRNQLDNKQTALRKLHLLIKKDLVVVKPRKKMPTPASVKNNILKNKAIRSNIKQMRQKPILGRED